MRIEFDPTNRDEATAVRAVLAALHPDTQGNNWEQRFADLTGSDDPEELERIEAEVKELLSVDANNEPHDPRIHSTPAKTNADGTWRAKRGVTAEQVASVRAERNLTATDEELIEQAEPLEIAPAQEQSAPPAPSAPVPAPTPPSAPSAPSGQSEAPLAPAAPSGQSEAPLAPAAPSATTQEEQNTDLATSAAPVSFLDVMKAITAAQKAGKVDTAKVKELCAAIDAGDSTMGLNGADKGEHRQVFLQVLGLEPKERDAIIDAAQGEPGIDTVRALLGGA